MDEMNIDELVEAEFAEQLKMGLVPAPKPQSVRISYKVETGGRTVKRTRTVLASDVERTITKLLDKGAFDFDTN